MTEIIASEQNEFFRDSLESMPSSIDGDPFLGIIAGIHPTKLEQEMWSTKGNFENLAGLLIDRGFTEEQLEAFFSSDEAASLYSEDKTDPPLVAEMSKGIRDLYEQIAAFAKQQLTEHDIAVGVEERRDKLGRFSKVATWVAGFALGASISFGITQSMNAITAGEFSNVENVVAEAGLLLGVDGAILFGTVYAADVISRRRAHNKAAELTETPNTRYNNQLLDFS